MRFADDSNLNIDSVMTEELQGASDLGVGRSEVVHEDRDENHCPTSVEGLNTISEIAIDALTSGRKDLKSKEMSKVEREVADTFNELDTYFVGDNLPSLQKEEFKYKATGLMLRERLEIPIIIQSPETVVTYEFSADPPCLKFGITFIAALAEGETLDDLDLEEVEELKLVNSRPNNTVDATGAMAYSYQGSFVVGDEGVVFLIFDVDDSWSLFNNGTNVLSYDVKVVQPTFAYVDELRCEQALALLQEGEDEVGLARSNHADLTTSIMKITSELEKLELQKFSLERQLSKKAAAREALFGDMYRDLDKVEEGYDVINGLCIRVLNRYLLSELMSFLIEPKPEVVAAEEATAAALRGEEKVRVTGFENDHTRDLALVSKYWCHVALSTRAFGPAERSVVTERPGYGPRWERGVEVGIPYSKHDEAEAEELARNREDLGVIVQADKRLEKCVEEEAFDGAIVVPSEGGGTTATSKVSGEQRSTAENLMLQKLAMKERKKVQMKEREKQRKRELERVEREKAKANRWHQKELQRRKLFRQKQKQQMSTMRQRVIVEEDSSDTSSSEISSSSTTPSLASTSSFGSAPLTVKVPPKTLLPVEEEMGQKVPPFLVLKSGDEIKTQSLAYSVFKHVEALVAKADKAYLEKRRLRLLISNWCEAFYNQHRRQPTVTDKRENRVSYELYSKYGRLREKYRQCLQVIETTLEKEQGDGD